MVGTYDSWLVVLSIGVAVVASYVAIDLASRVTAWKGSGGRWYWLGGGAFSMGTGIWSMHFIGMLAFRLPIALSYDVPITLGSWLIAVVVSGFALSTVSHGTQSYRRLVGAGVLMGLGIAAMHYTGMAAMRMQPPIRYEPGLFALSILIAIAASVVALRIAFRLRAETVLSAFRKKAGSAVVMGIAIAGMHYTGMAAAGFAPDSRCLVAPQHIDKVWLAGIIGAFTVMFLATTLLVSVFDARLAERSARLAATLQAANVELERVNERFQLVARATNDAVWDWDLLSDALWWNDGLYSLFGHRPEEVEPSIQSWYSRIHPEDRERVVSGIHAVIDAGGQAWSAEYRFRRSDGTDAHVLDRGYVIRTADRQAVRMIGAIMDISERQRAEQATARHALHQEIVAAIGQFALGAPPMDELFHEATTRVALGLGVEHAQVWQVLAGEATLVLRAAAGADRSGGAEHTVAPGPGSAFADCLARHEPVVVGDFLADPRFDPRQPPANRGARSAAIVAIHGRSGPFGVLCACGQRARQFPADDVNFLQAVANVLAAAIERRETEERLAYLAQFDPLTGLPNRNLFRDRLAHAIARAHRAERPMALAFLDLDRFKEINDTLGHEAGDRILKEISARLPGALREGDTIARLGGDEFTVILEDVQNRDGIAAVARKVLAVFARPVRVADRDLFITTSVGIAVYPGDGPDVDTLLKHADTAMYHAKSEGRNNFQFYSAKMSAAASERMTLENHLRQALEQCEFRLHYQPIVDIRSGAIASVEALLRWQHPEWGLVAPGRFIGVAEQTGLIVPIGEWVLREACAQAVRWRAAGLPAFEVAVNLSARQFRKSNLVEVVAGALADTGLDGRLLKLEITESLLMENPDASSAVLARLKAMGIRIALDDFGTGYSSLAYLKHFPLDIVKIDQAFVRDLTRDADDAAIVQAMIGLAHNLQLQLTAEGVETPEQLDFLHRHGCDYAQGYLFSRPVPAPDLGALLAAGRALPAAVTAGAG